ncbi:MAG: hypothetical protein C5B59_10610 [Bacteroidetes bacterium]|nr:MAG: hypothetical protein C5B59_10610 [Bacteroidota bacterium]
MPLVNSTLDNKSKHYKMKTLNYSKATYSVEIELSKPQHEVFDHVIDLGKWWPEQFVGESIKPGARFDLKVGDDHYSKNRVEDFVPGEKLVWLTTESMRKSDNFDWSGTKFSFELTPKGSNTLLRFTYDGVVLENERKRLAEICDMCIKVMFYNFIESFSATIEVTKSPEEVFNCLTDTAKWWGGNDFAGSSTKLNDEFIINHPGAHYSKQKLVEVIANKKMVWLVTESKLSWIKVQDEWTNTRMIFDLIVNENRTVLHFTHEGLTSEKECYSLCSEGWNMVIKDWLFKFITEGRPHFQLNSKENTKANQNFSCSATANIRAEEALKKISRIPEWWGVTFEGSSQKQNDMFIVKMSGDSFFNFTVTELIPGKRVVWTVTDCNMPWYADKKEWSNTKLIFDVLENNGTTEVTFTHQGLTPDLACYNDCEPGWTHWITVSLFSYLATGKGVFRQPTK